jgi:proline iminopeptidase
MRWLLVFAIACGSSTPVAAPKAPSLPNGAHRIAVDGRDVAIQIHGSGPVCIAHPGGPGLTAEYMRLHAFEKRFTVVYIDPLGTGPSAKLPETERYSIERDAGVVEAVRAKLELERVCLIGHSYGGFVVLSYAVAHPTRVGSLFLYSTSPTTEPEFITELVASAKWFEKQPWFADAFKAITEDEPKATTEAELNAVFQRALPLYVADYLGRQAEFAPLFAQLKITYEVYRRRVEGKLGRYDVRRDLGRLGTTPAMIVTGEKDFICGPVPSKWIASGIAGSKVVVIPRAGHFAHVEQPGAFEDSVATFAAMQR